MEIRSSLPQTFAELHDTLASLDIKTKFDEYFLIVNDDVHNITVIFSTSKNLSFLEQSDTFLMDGTIYACPSLFTQLFIVHRRKKHTHVLLVYCLLDGNNYWNLLVYSSKISSLLPSSYTPPLVSIDFVHSIHAVVLPTAVIEGCRFHLGRAWFRKIQALIILSQ